MNSTNPLKRFIKKRNSKNNSSPDSQDDYMIFFKEYNGSQMIENFPSDDLVKNIMQFLKSRDKQYSDLLQDFTTYAHERNIVKANQRKDFYDLVKTILCFSGIIFIILACRILLMTPKEISLLLPAIITGFISFFAEFISLLAIIAKYLFDSKEDDNITKIITHTQDFDNGGREYIKNASENQ